MAKSKDYVELIFLALTIILPLLISYYALGAEGGFSSQAYQERSTFYGPMLIGSGIVLLIFALLKLSPAKNNNFIRETFTHEPEKSSLYKSLKIPLKYYDTIPKIVLLSFLVFSLVGAVVVINQNITLTQVGFVAQQVTKVGEAIGPVFPGAVAETILQQAVMMVLLGIVGLYTTKKNKGLKGTLIFLVILLMGLGWAIFHTQAYGNDQVQFGLTFLFGLTGALITYVTLSIYPFIIWHIVHNLFASLRTIFSNQVTIVFLVVLFGVTSFLYIRALRSKKK